MNAIVLSAGLGTRLGGLGKRIPKVLVPIGGRPLLERHLEALAGAGVQRVVVNTYHLSHQVEAFVRGYAGPLELVCLVEPRLLGTAGSVRAALRYLQPGPFLVLYGDVFVEDELGPLVRSHLDRRPVATLAVHEESSSEGKGVVEVDATGRVTGFVEKGDERNGRFLINSGIYAVETPLVVSLPEAVPLDFGHDVLPEAIRAGRTIAAHQLSRPAIDIGTFAGLQRAQALVS